MEEEFRLEYVHRETRKKFRGKMVTRLDYVLIDPETMQRFPVTRHFLLKDYEAAASNNRAGKKNRIKFKKSA